MLDNINVFSIYYYAAISRESSVLIIGGVCDELSSSLIAKYTIDKWERAGNLQNLRQGHRAIENDNRIYVVGGYWIQYVTSNSLFPQHLI